MSNETIIEVGADKQYTTINAAILAADQMGGNADIKIDAGTYTNDGGYLWDGVNNVTIEGVGGMVKIVDPIYNAGGKAAIVTGGQNIVLENLDISGVSVPDGNGAGVRYDQGTLTLDNVSLHDNQEGILGAPDPNGSILIENSDIYDNGTDVGNTHNIYIGNIAQFTLTNSYVHDANVGHEVKSRAENNTITNNVIADNAGSSSYSIDLPNGGNAVITGNVIEQGVNGENYTINSYGEEGLTNNGTSVTFSDNTIVNDNVNGSGPLWANNGGTITGTGNSVWNLTSFGDVSLINTVTLSSRPDISAAVPVAQLPPAVTLPGNAVAVYRFFDEDNGTQFLTASIDERNTVLQTRPDMTYEGLGMASLASTNGDSAATPLYRFFDTGNGTHFFTASAAEEQTILQTRPDLVPEASTIYEDITQQPGDVPVYRFFDSSNGSHFYTVSSAESATLSLTRPDMSYEGIAFYAPST